MTHETTGAGPQGEFREITRPRLLTADDLEQIRRRVWPCPDGSYRSDVLALLDHAAAAEARYVSTAAELAALRAKAEALASALRGLLDLMRHPGESHLDAYERCAAVYRRETGYLAPGKDAAPGSYEGTQEERRARFDAWVEQRVAAALAASRGGKGAG